jgi:hypothetical protein
MKKITVSAEFSSFGKLPAVFDHFSPFAETQGDFFSYFLTPN